MATVISPRIVVSKDLFNKNERHILEIGCGNGEFLLQLSEARKGYTIWGLDISNFALKKALSRTKNLENVFLVKSEGKWFLQWITSPHSLDEVYLLFPDPWPGREKRRIVDTYFLELLSSRLKPEGRFFFSTDVEDYFFNVRELFEKSNNFEIIDGVSAFYTKYERKWRAAGRKTYSLSVVKKGEFRNSKTYKTFLNYPQKVSLSRDTLLNLTGMELRVKDVFFKIIKTFENPSGILYKTVFRFRNTGQKQLFLIKNGEIDLLPVQAEIYPEPLVEVIKLIFS